MMSSSPQSQESLSQRRRRRRALAPLPRGWIVLTLLLYGAAGLILATFPIPYWLWLLAVGGAIAQSIALAGPRSLRRFRGWFANLLALLAIVGTGAMVVALSAALGFVGSATLEDINLNQTFWEIVQVSLVALVVATLAALISAETGDRLLTRLTHLQTTLLLVVTCCLGLGAGALVGWLLVG